MDTVLIAQPQPEPVEFLIDDGDWINDSDADDDAVADDGTVQSLLHT